MVDTLYLVDGHSQMYVAYHALEPLAAPDGQPTGAVYGFLLLLRKLIETHAPDRLAVIFDAPGPTFRHEAFADYKAHRPAAPDDFRTQLDLVREALAAWPIPTLEAPGYEADDVLATLAVRHASPTNKVVLVTPDKDVRQLLVEGQIEIFDARKQQFLTARRLFERDGIRPDQVVDYLTMLGDSSDNVPGIPLIGKKKAAALLQKYDSLDNALVHAEEVTGKTGANLVAARETAPAMRDLVRLHTDVPVALDLEACQRRAPDPVAMAPLYRRLGFVRWLEEMGTGREQPLTLRSVSDDDALARLAEAASGVEALAIELLRRGEPRTGELVGLGLCWTEGEAWYLPLDDAGDADPEGRWELARALLGPAGPRIVGHQLGAPYVALAARGVELTPIGFDTGLAAYLLNPTLARYDLAAVALTHLGEGYDPTPAAPREASLFDDLDLEHHAKVGARGAELTWRLFELFGPYLEKRGLRALLDDVELPLLPVLGRMELAGVALDTAVLAEMGAELTAAADLHRERIHELAGAPFNPDSPQQLAEVLFDRLGLPARRRGRTGPSTDADVLRELSHLHPLPGEVLAYRKLVKLNNTYVEALPRMLDGRTRRLHTRFNQTGTATGRLASEHPNLQNVPIRTELGQRIRGAFVAPEGMRLMAADYSQVELRILAHVSGDAALTDAFRTGGDIHRAVAARIAGIAEDEVDSAMRRRAKTVNFGIVYGQTPIGLARELEISRDEAETFIERYFERFPQVKAYIESCIAQARAEGEVRTLLGRVRQLPEINSRRYFRRAFSERTAVNTVIQGTAADLIKLAMIALDRRLAESEMPARLLLSIHDELVVEYDPACEAELAATIREVMVGAMTFDVPLVVDIGIGEDWLNAGKGSLPEAEDEDDDAADDDEQPADDDSFADLPLWGSA